MRARLEPLVIEQVLARRGLMEIRVDRELCEANGRCVRVAADVFSLDDDEILQIRAPANGVDPERIERAVASCPLNALSIGTAGRSVSHP
jgi:ferredoxin